MADRMVDGRLTAIIVEKRAEGVSAEGIARILYADHGIVTTGQTIRRWLRQLDAEAVA